MTINKFKRDMGKVEKVQKMPTRMTKSIKWLIGETEEACEIVGAY